MKLGIILLILTSSLAFAHDEKDVEIIGGGVNYDVIDNGSSGHDVTKWSKDGRLTFQPMTGVRFMGEGPIMYHSIAFIGAYNAVGLPMYGVLGTQGYTASHIYLGLAEGLFGQNDNNYRAKGVEPYRFTEVGGSIGLVPLIGVDIGYKWDLSNRFYLKTNNILSPTIINSNLSVGFVL